MKPVFLALLAAVLCATGSAAQQDPQPDYFENTALFPGFDAIWRHDPTLADPVDIAVDALHALQVIATHPANCLGDRAEPVSFARSVTTTTRNGFGVETGSETDVYEQTLRVRPEFAPWVRRNLRAMSTNPLSGVQHNVDMLLDREGCYSAAYRQLEVGLAAVMGVALSAAPEPPGLEEGDWRAFVATCQPAFMRESKAQSGFDMTEGMAALYCICAENAARVAGDAGFYEALRIADLSGYDTLPEGYQAPFDACFHQRQPAELDRRITNYTAGR